ncbi:MAG: hypothetical protein ACFFKA_12070, partial [Candidatus Thorarchaeota archaeon]
ESLRVCDNSWKCSSSYTGFGNYNNGSISSDYNGNNYIMGFINGQSVATFGSINIFSNNINTMVDIFIAKINSSGNCSQ